MNKIFTPAQEQEVIITCYEVMRESPRLAHIPDAEMWEIITHMVQEHPERYFTPPQDLITDD